ncbi:tubulin-like doman-containing protein [Gemmata sp. JC717]|uniref:tubulin-like doman-containing protein n=1 Tax=Gemmata algarum TaxID=2975278 RepID=UPI0021BB8881|nr:tubulin-like doman-containing protein [Gemmata algarum]MDY3553559.1 tubulin-like doman-containing protein [Gemmata algarum]
MPVRLVSHEELPHPLNGYRLIERLGRGGFGEVWKIEAPGGLLKAAKFVFGDLDAMDEDSRPAEQELKALERVKLIRHPYILTLEQFRVIDGQLIIVMELADRNLWDRFRECRSQGLPGIPRDELLRYMEEAAEGLDLMNNHYQIQHLDVKPQNLFLLFNHVKVADFGLAKVLEGVRATVTGGVTPVYAAPETFEGWVSRFSDQYSLAIVFQELLTGARPFTGSNTRQLLMQHINGTPDLSALPLADRVIVGRALSKRPDDRWPTCTDLVRALKTSGLPPPPPTPTPAQTQPEPPGRPKRPVPGSGAPTMPAAAGHALADSIQVTRMAGGSGQLGAAPGLTPPPTQLPPLIKPGGSPAYTPLPALVPPNPSSGRLVSPGSAAQNPSQTLNRPVVMPTGRMGSLGIAPPERSGDGALFPALVVALGHTGRRVVEQLKRIITDRYASAERVPNVRILHIDTDPGAGGGDASDPAGLTVREVIPARLNRSTHYMQRDGLPPVEQWMPTGSLYKLPRNPGPAAGVRAFGRLALFDHYRAVAQRVRQEIETFLTDDPLLQADKATNLGLRTNRPRAYVVAGLAGGTGGGMFLDVAYLLRHELRQVGYLRPEVVGVFFVPRAEVSSPRNAALANTYAALAELHHFQSKRTRYQTVFDKSEAPVTDGEAPFARVMVTQLPKSADAGAAHPVTGAAARALFHELLTPTGRVADEGRDVYSRAYPADAPTCQTYGLFRLSWPRPEVLAAATRRLAQRQLQRWTGKDAAHLREHIAAWLGQQWADRNLAFDAVVEALQGAARAALREDPEKVFDAFIDPLRTRTPSGGRMDATSACAVLDQLIKLVGKPDIENDPQTGTLHAAMSRKFDELVKETEGHVSVMAATFLEVPQYRLPGAEEAVRQIAERLKGQIDALEGVRADLDRDVRTAYARLFSAIGSLGGTGLGAMASRKANAAEVLDHLRAYPRKRLQLHTLDLALSVFRKLLGNAPEYLREINFCRSTLGEMHAALGAAAGPVGAPDAPGKLILPDGCKSLDDAADLFLAGVAPEDLLAFDQALQRDITRKFRGLGNVCLKPLEKGPPLRELLLKKAREFLDAKLDHSDAAAVFFRSRTENGTAQPLLGEAFEEASPELIPNVFPRPYEMVVLGAPPGPDGDRLQELARVVLPETEFVGAPLPDDICFYREYPQLKLADLPQLGEYAREAYQQMAAGGEFPHARTDVPWQLPIT